MTDICIYFQVHQPNRLRKYTYFDVGSVHHYEDDEANKRIFLKVANKCYLPATALLLKMIHEHKGKFKVAFSLSGIFVEQCKKYSPELLNAFKKLAKTKCVEFLNETYYHSLSFLFSKDEFKRQVMLHRNLIQKEFGYKATTFRNTELIYNNEIAASVESLGFKGILAEGTEKILGWRSSNYIYQPETCKKIKLLLRNYRLTDDIAFRFSNKHWSEYPLNADKFANWVHSLDAKAHVVNLFMDFETFGEHHWEDTGIFEFLQHLPRAIMQHKNFHFVTPAEAIAKHKAIAKLDVPYYVSWADVERDLTAWNGNELQKDSLEAIYALETKVKSTKNPHLVHAWRKLQTSDHFYYMCTKFDNDGDVHKYFNPYSNPYDAYTNYQNILSDFSWEVTKHKVIKREKKLSAFLNADLGKMIKNLFYSDDVILK